MRIAPGTANAQGENRLTLFVVDLGDATQLRVARQIELDPLDSISLFQGLLQTPRALLVGRLQRYSVTLDYRKGSEPGTEQGDCQYRGAFGSYDYEADNCQVYYRELDSLLLEGDRALLQAAAQADAHAGSFAERMSRPGGEGRRYCAKKPS